MIIGNFACTLGPGKKQTPHQRGLFTRSSAAATRQSTGLIVAVRVAVAEQRGHFALRGAPLRMGGRGAVAGRPVLALRRNIITVRISFTTLTLIRPRTRRGITLGLVVAWRRVLDITVRFAARLWGLRSV